MNSIAFILKGYPRLSETFIAREMEALERGGLDLHIYSLRHPTDHTCHAVHDKVRAAVHYLPEYLHREPLRVWRAWRRCRGLPGYDGARRAFVRDLRRDRSRNRVRRFGQALVLAAELAPGIEALHAHFLHTPASVARYASLLCGLPWSGSAHAKDIWTQADWEIREKLAECSWLVTCTRHNHRHLRTMQARDGQVGLVYHGLDFTQFAAPSADGAVRDGPLRILSVGRAVPKKGYGVLLAALAALDDEPDWLLEHVGGGPLSGALKREAARLGIAGRIRWRGAQPEDEVLAAYRRADLFVLASRIEDDGDRDGLPNVLLEAQSQGVACVATRVSGIPELIADGETGVLVAQNDAAALTAALRRLLRDGAARRALAAAGQRRVRREFDMGRATTMLLARFRDGYRGVP